MATVNINMFREKTLGETPVYNVDEETMNETITSSAVSQATTITTDGNSRLVRIASDGNVWVAFGTAPVAVTSTGRLILANVPEVLYVPVGTKVAVVD